MVFGNQFFCVNADTKDIHSEDDCSYTVITVPKQEAMIKKGNISLCLH